MSIKLNIPLENLQDFGLEESHIGKMVFGHLFIAIGARNILFLRAGDFVTKEIYEKYCKSSIKILSPLDQDAVNTIEDYLRIIKVGSSSEEEKLTAKSDLLLFFRRKCLNGDLSVLNFYYAFKKLFKLYDLDLAYEQYKVSHILNHRAILSATLSTLSALMLNVVDFSCLKDIFNTSFFMDVGLIKQSIPCFHIMQAAEKERLNIGDGKKYLEHLVASDTLISIFDQHPIFSYDMIRRSIQKFSYPEIAKIVKCHHENLEGTGFPSSMSYHVTSKFEQIIHYSDTIIPFNTFDFVYGDFEAIKTLIFQNKDISWVRGKWSSYVAYKEAA
ncbi:MAG: hypothetical protein N4A33_11300 [Bacteriovoracaceae bacterium]|jgi:hypothetical protein|nr:hypothetical protein [Bacteriovoracaceae bacterium]